MGNKLYCDKKVINFLEITKSSEPSIDKDLYSVITEQIDNENYLHYSKEYIQGKVVIYIKIGTEKKPCDDKDKNENLDIKNYKCKNKDLDLGNTYEKLDETTARDYSNIKIKDKNQKIYLYKRTYISAPKQYIEYHNFDDLKKLSNKKIKKIGNYDIIAYIFNPFDGAILQEPIFIIIYLFIGFILITVISVLKIKLLNQNIKIYNIYEKLIFSKLNHVIKNYYTSKVWFMKIDKANLVLEYILLIPFTCLMIILIYIGLKKLGLFVEKKVIGKVKDMLERKKRIKTIKNEIEELEKNLNVPKYKINQKRLEFFKEKFHDALTCPISLDLFKDPVIVTSGHTYEREYIANVIHQSGKDPQTRQKLKLDDIASNYLVSQIVNIFNSSEEFNEKTYNDIIKLLKCPLSKKLYSNPYLAKTSGNKGMTYEKLFIEEYILNNKNDPTFNTPINKNDLIKNYVIKDMVDAIDEMNKNKQKYSINLEISDEKIDNNNIKKENKLNIYLAENNNIESEIKINNDLIDEN